MKTPNLLKIRLLSLILVILALSNCKKTTTPKVEEDKQPISDFVTDKAEYTAGETIYLTNKSIDGNTFTWTFPDGSTAKSTDASYVTTSTLGDIKLPFKLDAISKGGKIDYSLKNINIKAAIGQLVLYDGYYSGPSDIFVDGVKLGTVYCPVPNFGDPIVIPTCGQQNYYTFNIKVGVHSLLVTGLRTWNKSIEIKANQCTVVWLYNS